MVSRQNLLTVTLLCVLAALLTACQKEAQKNQPQPANQPAQSQPASPTPQPQPAATAGSPAAIPAGAPPATTSVIASAQYSADPDLRCDLLEVKRVSGGAVMVRWRVVNTTTAAQSGLTATQPKSINYDFSWEQIYYIDPAENKKYNFLTDAEGQRILDVWHGNLGPGEQRANWAKFPAPPVTSKKISINISRFPPFEDVSIAE